MSSVVRLSESVISPLGMNLHSTFSSILEGQSRLSGYDGTFGVREPFVASLLNREKIFDEAAAMRINGETFFDTLLILAASKALLESGVDPSSHSVRIVVSSIKGNIDKLEEDCNKVPLSYSARRLGSFLKNPNPVIVVSNACISGLSALDHARKMLSAGICKHVLVVGGECMSRFIISGFQSLKALSDSFCKPFDVARNGLNPGEAAAAMVLGIKDCPSQDDWCLEIGATRNDANHISGPSRVAEGSFKALEYVLKDCNISDLSFVNVHGTATLYNDEMESMALERAGLSQLPLNALKGYLGHTMGAAGILETLLSMEAVDNGVILPTKGFDKLGVSHPVNVSAELRRSNKKAFVKLLSGFGGCNAAMLFRKGGRI